MRNVINKLLTRKRGRLERESSRGRGNQDAESAGTSAARNRLRWALMCFKRASVERPGLVVRVGVVMLAKLGSGDAGGCFVGSLDAARVGGKVYMWIVWLF